MRPCMRNAAAAVVTVAVAISVMPAAAWAHTGEPLAPHDLWTAWEWTPSILIPVLVSGALYALGLSRLWRRGIGRGIRRWEASCFATGWLVLALALLSPLHPLGEALFSAHMVQHELLMVVAAPLLVLGRPLVSWLHAIPVSSRRAMGAVTRNRRFRSGWRVLTYAGTAWVVQAVVLWGWHLPRLYDAALGSETVHAMQHISFLGAALLFWWALLHGRKSHARGVTAVLYLFTTAVHSTLLGMLLTFASSPWYAHYQTISPAWGITPLEDQQLAGLIMWIPAGISYLIAALLLASRWLLDSDPAAMRKTLLRGVVSAAAVIAVISASACNDTNIYADATALTHGNPARGRALICSYGCGSCHTIPGIRGADATVGPPLAGIASRSYIGGVLPNDPDNMVRWLLDPPAVDSMTAMPNVGLNELQARDVAAYMYTLK